MQNRKCSYVVIRKWKGMDCSYIHHFYPLSIIFFIIILLHCSFTCHSYCSSLFIHLLSQLFLFFTNPLYIPIIHVLHCSSTCYPYCSCSSLFIHLSSMFSTVHPLVLSCLGGCEWNSALDSFKFLRWSITTHFKVWFESVMSGWLAPPDSWLTCTKAARRNNDDENGG